MNPRPEQKGNRTNSQDAPVSTATVPGRRRPFLPCGPDVAPSAEEGAVVLVLRPV